MQLDYNRICHLKAVTWTIYHGKTVADAPLCFLSKYLGQKELRTG